MQKTALQSGVLIAALVAAYFIATPSQKNNPRDVTSRGPASAGPSPRGIQAPAVQQSGLEQSLARLPLSAGEQKLLASQNVNVWEKKLKIAMVAGFHKNKIPNADQLGAQSVEQMKKHPLEAIQAIKSLLDKVSSREFPIERASLIDVAGDIPGYRDEAKALAISELRNSVVPRREIPQGDGVSEEQLDQALSSRDQDLLPIVSHSVILRTASSPQEALQLTIDGMRVQEDLTIRGVMANQFVNAYPKLASNLQDEIRRNRIEMPATGNH